ncbi:MAG: hypothetical protein K5657_02380 [Desulfovibrio sp.]|nr:hypothetical protein [Desulfovibrio sp.]
MSFGTIGLLARLWQAKGLRVLLSENPVPPELSLLRYGRALQRGKETNGRLLRANPARSMPRRESPPTSSSPVSERQGEPEDPLLAPVGAPAVWPDVWKKLLDGAKTGPVVWTYSSLGLDLLQRQTQGIDGRRGFLRRLLTQKPTFPAGTHTFWPYVLPNEAGDLCADADLFWAGVQALGGRVVMILGEEACAFLLKKRPPYFQTRMHGVHVTVFQSVEILNADNALFTRMHAMAVDVIIRYAGTHPS